MPDSRWKLISIRTLCGEGDPLAPRSTLTRKLFLSTPSARRATAEAGKMVVGANHFYPRPPRGGRHASRRHRQHRANFYPRPPRGGRQWGLDLRYFYCGISIHALREEGDVRHGWSRTTPRYFYPRPPRGGRPVDYGAGTAGILISIHALREEGDRSGQTIFRPGTRFLSTPSARRATRADSRWFDLRVYFYPRPPRGGRLVSMVLHTFLCYFYPRPPRGGRPYITATPTTLSNISIHALREEGDTATPQQLLPKFYFYPRPPRGGRLLSPALTSLICDISIHALREEGDVIFMLLSCYGCNFYPRPPRGGRHKPCNLRNSSILISIHALREEGDTVTLPEQKARKISIHALREEGDHYAPTVKAWNRISIHALREEGDAPSPALPATWTYFYPRPPRGGRRVAKGGDVRVLDFYPRPPRGGRRASVGDIIKRA